MQEKGRNMGKKNFDFFSKKEKIPSSNKDSFVNKQKTENLEIYNKNREKIKQLIVDIKKIFEELLYLRKDASDAIKKYKEITSLNDFSFQRYLMYKNRKWNSYESLPCFGNLPTTHFPQSEQENFQIALQSTYDANYFLEIIIKNLRSIYDDINNLLKKPHLLEEEEINLITFYKNLFQGIDLTSIHKFSQYLDEQLDEQKKVLSVIDKFISVLNEKIKKPEDKKILKPNNLTIIDNNSEYLKIIKEGAKRRLNEETFLREEKRRQLLEEIKRIKQKWQKN